MNVCLLTKLMSSIFLNLSSFQSMLRLAQLDKIAERLSHHVMDHHEEMGMPPTRVEKRFRV
jgi:hypothetical protein